MIFIITGGIASGKSFVLKQLQKLGCLIFNSDLIAKEIMSQDWFIDQMKDQNIDHSNLRKEIEKNIKVLDYIESLVHSKVQIIRNHWIASHININLFLAIEMPLLFEKNLLESLQQYNPIIISTVCNKQLQIKRAKKRNKEISNNFLNIILSRQSCNEKRVARSEFVIYTSFSKYVVKKQINKIFKSCNERHNRNCS